MIKLNKYLREIGIDEKYWLFSEENKDDERYLPDKDGFVEAEFFDLDTSLSLYIYSQLCYFRDNCSFITPQGMSDEKWHDILNKMIEAFKLMIVDDKNDFVMSQKKQRMLSKNKYKKINYGLRLFIKYYRCLWY